MENEIKQKATVKDLWLKIGLLGIAGGVFTPVESMATARRPAPRGTATAAPAAKAKLDPKKAAEELAGQIVQMYANYVAGQNIPPDCRSPVAPDLVSVQALLAKVTQWEADMTKASNTKQLDRKYGVYVLSKAIATIVEERFGIKLGNSPLKVLNGLSSGGYRGPIESMIEKVANVLRYNPGKGMDESEAGAFGNLLLALETQCEIAGIWTGRAKKDPKSLLSPATNDFWDVVQGINLPPVPAKAPSLPPAF